MKKLAAVLGTLMVFAATAILVWAEAPVGVTPIVIGRATFDSFKVKTDPHSPVDFDAKAKDPFDMVVRTHDYAVGGSTGWHTHPGPIFINVIQGTVTFYEADDPFCRPHVVSAGQGYVDTGHGHIGRNESGLPAKDVSVILAPVGLPFRNELPAPGAYCPF